MQSFIGGRRKSCRLRYAPLPLLDARQHQLARRDEPSKGCVCGIYCAASAPSPFVRVRPLTCLCIRGLQRPIRAPPCTYGATGRRQRAERLRARIPVPARVGCRWLFISTAGALLDAVVRWPATVAVVQRCCAGSVIPIILGSDFRGLALLAYRQNHVDEHGRAPPFAAIMSLPSVDKTSVSRQVETS
ncbi:hypothetical protein EJ04DRAFT_525635 [Polyplosphaeria fusca]|uniref:Uncharacterized protein n=1 Tax=Polyplosphaeria fusca TaxID=682080 RepID=A0A9P4V0F4_9PLEO|nr:hypothetical protein EJ04DRAFT_525635 [Polyplosphaeria fusca]